MCGIVGCVLKENKNVAPILFECISKLEYRGYDSVGLATFDDVIYVKKSKGNIEELNKTLNLAKLPGRYGISHLRWASVGKPSNENTHPHLDETHSIAIVHNGTLENYSELKNELIDEGHRFYSKTDSEVIVHLIEKYMDKNMDLEHALRKTTQHIEGSYAIAAISKNEPGKIVATKNDSPLNVAQGDEGYFVTSDVPGTIEYARNVIRLKDDEIAILDENGIAIHDETGKDKDLKFTYIDWDLKNTEVKSFKHFMIKEIHEQPRAINDTLKQKTQIQKIFDEIGEIKRICFVGGGSSYNASITGKYLFESLTHIPTDVVNVSEYDYASKTWDEDTLVIFISEMGESPDIIRAFRQAKKTSKTLAVANVSDPTIAEESENFIQTMAGPEIGMCETKTYIAQLTVIYMIAGILSQNNAIINELYHIPAYIYEVLEKSDEIEELTERYAFEDNALVIGSGFAYPIALEGSLKLMETAGIYAISCGGGELKQGKLTLVNDNIPVIVVVPPGKDYQQTMNDLLQVKMFEGTILSVGPKDDEELNNISDSVIEINPQVRDIFAPLVYITALQLLSYYVSVKKGYDPDRPGKIVAV